MKVVKEGNVDFYVLEQICYPLNFGVRTMKFQHCCPPEKFLLESQKICYCPLPLEKIYPTHMFVIILLCFVIKIQEKRQWPRH